jgi:hypothetical protein
MEREVGVSCLEQYCQFPPTQLNSETFYVIFAGTSTPSEALRPPSKMLREYFKPLTASLQDY